MMSLIESGVFCLFLLPSFELKSSCFILSSNHPQTTVNGVKSREEGNLCIAHLTLQDFVKHSWECHNDIKCRGFQFRVSDGEVSHEVLDEFKSSCSAKVGEKCILLKSESLKCLKSNHCWSDNDC